MRTKRVFLTLLAAPLILPACGVVDSMPDGANSIMAVMQPPTPTEAVEMAIDKYSADNRFKGIQLLSSADFGGQPVYMGLYEHAINDTDSGVRWVAVRALARHGGPEHAELIMDRFVHDKDARVRAEGARGLQRLHNPIVIEALLRAIRTDAEPVADVRTEAASALGQYAENRVVGALIGALKDPSLAVNRATVSSLRTLTGQDFDLDTRAWLDWVDGHKDTVFAARQPYTYPAFWRDRRPVEYLPLPFIAQPPNESESLPVGMEPVLDS